MIDDPRFKAVVERGWANAQPSPIRLLMKKARQKGRGAVKAAIALSGPILGER